MTARTYRVVWEIDIDAESPREAAEKARALQLKPDAHVGNFKVRVDDQHGRSAYVIDLDMPGESSDD